MGRLTGGEVRELPYIVKANEPEETACCTDPVARDGAKRTRELSEQWG